MQNKNAEQLSGMSESECVHFSVCVCVYIFCVYVCLCVTQPMPGISDGNTVRL